MVAGCNQPDIGDGRFPNRPRFKLPGENVASAAFNEQRRETALVSLLFDGVGGVESIEATDRLTEREIEFHSVELDNLLVVTLKLPKGQFSSPQIRFFGTKMQSFTAQLTPQHLLETYRGLTLDGPTMVLRDHGESVELEVGRDTVISSENFTTLWLDESLQTVARAHLTNVGHDAGSFLIWSPEGCKAWMQPGGRLESTNVEVDLDSHECIGLVVAPESELPLTLHVERR